MPFLAKLALAALAVYALIVLAAYLGQRKLMYFPDPARVAPASAGLGEVEERTLATPDGARVVVWYGRARPGQPTLLYFHGNGGGLADRAPRFRRFMAEGWGVYMMSYRGYSGSSGAPSERANVADARLAYGALLLEGVDARTVILYGESLGSGVATRIAAERPVGGLILEAPYTSAIAVGNHAYPFLPVRFLLVDRYETDRYIGQVRAPLLIVHGERDRVVPVAMGRELARMAHEPKRLVVLPRAGHADIYVDGNDAMAAVRAWVADLKL
jgi:fermentation-respiration switch protein FrsA (DUF1100 family)